MIHGDSPRGRDPAAAALSIYLHACVSLHLCVAPTPSGVRLAAAGVHERSLIDTGGHAGVHTAVVYNSKGEPTDSFELPDAPLLPLVQCDFAGNGLTDLLLVTKEGVYGFQLVKNMGAGMPYATMLGGLLIAVVVVFATQQGPLSGHKARSTDRID